MKYGVVKQKQIYVDGMAGKRSAVPVRYERLEEKARAKLSPEAYAYIAGGAGSGTTMRANRRAFQNYALTGRMMAAAPKVDLEITLFGRKYPTPLFAAPIGVLEMADKRADLAVAEGCRSLGIPVIFSNQASVPMEACAAALGKSPRWFQLYWSKSDALTESLVRRAEACGCEAIVLTLDTTSLGWRPEDLDLAYLPFLRAMGIAQYTSDPIFQKITEENLRKKDKDGPKPPVNLTTLRNLFKVCRNYPGGFFRNLSSGRGLTGVRTFIDIYMRPELRWADIARLRQMTDLPVLVKGIHHVEDALAALDAGADGMIVSNHGGRQIDGGIGALTALDEIAQKIDGKVPVLFDSGIRCGADAIKAMALGADAVLIGRPYVYGLSLAGAAGVRAVFEYFLAEMELQLSLMGIRSVRGLSREVISEVRRRF